MIEPTDPHFPSECDLCGYNTRNSHLPCAVHPFKPMGDYCPSLHPDSSLPVGEWWEPEGASYYRFEVTLPEAK